MTDRIVYSIEHQKVDAHIAASINSARIAGADSYELEVIDRVYRSFSHWLLDRKLAQDDPNDVFETIATLFTNMTAELLVNGSPDTASAANLAQTLMNTYAEGVNNWLAAMGRDKTKDS